MHPRCSAGACAVAAKLIDPRSGKTLASAIVKPSADGYRLRLKTTRSDLCRTRNGRTVQGGAKRTTAFTLRPFVAASSGEVVMAAEVSIHLAPNARGRSVGCSDATIAAGVSPEKLASVQLASVQGRLSPVPPADLVPRPNFTVSIRAFARSTTT